MKRESLITWFVALCLVFTLTGTSGVVAAAESSTDDEQSISKWGGGSSDPRPGWGDDDDEDDDNTDDNVIYDNSKHSAHTTASCQIGARDAHPVTHFKGTIGEIVIFNRILTAEEIQIYYSMTSSRY